ncbi:hypothetical protein [Bosea sp. RAC05]|uniref:hypothetical protein n=1 Tax=Bosea sp. RAC05 TaxID=1842539 RepID=UPI00083CC2BC|nr:hypothetical protein [Bosea sp. RAC05]AOG03043.1 hypothetical protein BSY19_5333 [Bosea sp. RAC05]
MQILFRPRFPDPHTVARAPRWQDFSDAISRDHFDQAVTAYEELVRSWAQIFGLRNSQLDRAADLEDWSESAVRLVSWAKSGLPVYILDHSACLDCLPVVATWNTHSPLSANSPAIFSGTPLRFDPIFSRAYPGKSPLATLAWPHEGVLGRGGSYWRSPALLAALNRAAIVSSGDADGERGYVASTRSLIDRGCRDLMAKIIFQPKYQAPAQLQFRPGPEAPSDRGIQKAFFQAFDANLMDCEERETCFLIQERVPMIHEYRICVVGGEPVAGAGTIEWLSPIFRRDTDGAFHTLVEGKRSDRQVRDMPSLIGRYVSEARRLCASLRAEWGKGAHPFTNCTMDFAINADTQEVCLIETDALDNSGLYALDFAQVAAAILTEVSSVYGYGLAAGPWMAATNSRMSSAAMVSDATASRR